MLKLLCIKKSKINFIYHYFPEAKADYGILSITIATGEIQIIKVAENDAHRRYLLHAISELRKFHESGTYSTESTVAWY